MKKCIICGSEAAFSIKATSDYYCQDCAEEHFDDISYLEKIEESAKQDDDSLLQEDEEN